MGEKQPCEKEEEVLSLRRRCEAFGVVPKEEEQEEEEEEEDARIEDALTRAEVLWRRPGVEVGGRAALSEDRGAQRADRRVRRVQR
jgi:hypothetical protein